MKTFFKQCELKQGKTTYVAWIPEKYAKKGKNITIKKDGEWSEAWNVCKVFEKTRTDDPPDYRKLIKDHKQATGDSLPKMKPILTPKKKKKKK